MSNHTTLLKIENLQKYFPIKTNRLLTREKKYVKANKNISVNIKKGETLGIVGESGCGKSTFGRTIIQLHRQTGGSTRYYGDTIENFMPDYVRKVYENIPTLWRSFEKDREDLNRLNGHSTAIAKDGYRIAKHEFDLKYGNTLRLVGGLLVYPELKKVRDILLSRYRAGARLARLNRDIDFEVNRYQLSLQKNIKAKLSSERLIIERDKVEIMFRSIETELSIFKNTLRDHPDFAYFESFRDRGIDLSALRKKEMHSLRNDLQIIFQDPYSSLNPRMSVGEIIGEGLITHGLFKSKRSAGYQEYIFEIMEKCGLDRSYISRYPHQFSGGQRQRIGIARAIALKPKFIVCDEAVSALDVSIQSQVINLLQDLKREADLTYLFITHDLGVVRHISDRIGVMYFGNLVELAPAELIFSNPKHPYTKRLLSAIPSLNNPELKAILSDDTSDDRFTFRFETEEDGDRDWFECEPDHFVACHLLVYQGGDS